jgi:hypothetical protein
VALNGGDSDGFVQVAPDSTGKKIDNAELTREPVQTGFAPPSGSGLTVERQRIVIGSDENPRIQVEVRGEAGSAVLMMSSRSFDRLEQRLIELVEILKFQVFG